MIAVNHKSVLAVQGNWPTNWFGSTQGFSWRFPERLGYRSGVI